MNDNEIMKSLDACDNCFCENCSYKSKTIYCREELIKDALSLIRHQKSEIERLSKEIITLKYDLHVAGEESIEWKSTAIKEFAERLKENIDNGQLYNDGEDYALTIWHIDNLVKEMTESEGKEMREKLIELLGSKVCDGYSPTCDEWKPHSCEKCFANNCRIGELADYLLQNGVVVKEHGKWDRSGYCSNCNYWTCYCGDFNYCPNCGARMDGDEE